MDRPLFCPKNFPPTILRQKHEKRFPLCVKCRNPSGGPSLDSTPGCLETDPTAPPPTDPPLEPNPRWIRPWTPNTPTHPPNLSPTHPWIWPWNPTVRPTHPISGDQHRGAASPGNGQSPISCPHKLSASHSLNARKIWHRLGGFHSGFAFLKVCTQQHNISAESRGFHIG